MVQSNKILTVSYGTFSCTLEGFDDSFDTMKAIAEYFRDLAADDRYFGAEPPQPDADMLARIAQKEISRQVEVHKSNEGFALRAAEAAPDANTPVASPAVLPAAAPQTSAEPQIATPPADAQEEDDAGAMNAASPMPTVEEPEEEASFEAEPETDDLTEDEFAQDEQDETIEAEEVAQIIPEKAQHEQVEPTASDSIAAKLQRIRDVVSKDPDSTDEEYLEDEHADELSNDDADDITDILQAVEESTEVDAVQADEVSEAPVEIQDTDAHEEPHSSPVETADLKGQDSIFGDWDEDEFAEDDDELLNILNAGEDDLDDDIAPAAPSRPARVRVSRVKRAAVEAAAVAGSLDELEDASGSESSLTEEEEADLARELAAVTTEAETEISVSEPIVEDVAEEPEPFFQQDAAFDEADEEDDEEDLSRLMAAAEEKLDEPEGSDNRETFTQLRAVVAAASAERAAGGTVGMDNDPEPYKEDLASVVRPRRPVAGSGRSGRPAASSKPAPLKLVAEQRVDTPQENQGPVRPRRIQHAEPTVTATSGGFADYAAQHGAVELPELFEAAAAYLSFVENRERFSRPQLMNQVRQLDLPGFTREDGLRSFGQILRDGKIRKIENGRFTVSDDIGFQPDARAAG